MQNSDSSLSPESEITETIGHRIARHRKLKGLTQQQLADRIGIARIIISDYERGRLRLYDEMVGRMAKALRISSDDLLGIKSETEKSPEISLRFLKRIAIIETFSEAQKKRILRNLDDSIEASQNRESGSSLNEEN